MLNTSSGNGQIEIDEKEVDKTAFVIYQRLFQRTRISFEPMNAPATFQMAIDVILASVKWHCATVYVDNVINFSKSS